MTNDDIIRMAEEASGGRQPDGWGVMLDYEQLERFAALVAAAERERLKWDGLHSCHSECDRPACVHTRKTYQEGYEAGRKDENEACAEMVKNWKPEFFEHMTQEYAVHFIRQRREQ